MYLLRVFFTLAAFVLAQPVLAQGGPPPGGGGAESPTDALQEELDELAARVVALEALLAGMSRVGNDIYVDGANIHVRNGGGMTDVTNGLGNVIIGYNEERGDGTDDRTGSHMLVLGSSNNFTSFGGVVSGKTNATGAPHSSIIGGDNNKTLSVIDFTGNYTEYMVAIGGTGNESIGKGAVAVGGVRNDVSDEGPHAVIAGGRENSVQFGSTFIGGGRENIAYGFSSAIVGGRGNVTGAPKPDIIGFYSAIIGGRFNTATGSYATINGGQFNAANGRISTISGGQSNTADGVRSMISGGSAGSTTNDLENPDRHTP